MKLQVDNLHFFFFFIRSFWCKNVHEISWYCFVYFITFSTNASMATLQQNPIYLNVCVQLNIKALLFQQYKGSQKQLCSPAITKIFLATSSQSWRRFSCWTITLSHLYLKPSHFSSILHNLLTDIRLIPEPQLS